MRMATMVFVAPNRLEVSGESPRVSYLVRRARLTNVVRNPRAVIRALQLGAKSVRFEAL